MHKIAQAGIKLCTKAQFVPEESEEHVLWNSPVLMTCVHLIARNAIVDLTRKFINLTESKLNSKNHGKASSSIKSEADSEEI